MPVPVSPQSGSTKQDHIHHLSTLYGELLRGGKLYRKVDDFHRKLTHMTKAQLIVLARILGHVKTNEPPPSSPTPAISTPLREVVTNLKLYFPTEFNTYLATLRKVEMQQVKQLLTAMFHATTETSF